MNNKTTHPHTPVTCNPLPVTSAQRPGFTLVEVLVVIVIISILAAAAIPAINNSVKRARSTSQRMEVNSLASAIEQYQLKYGDYPPDGSEEAVMKRHFRKLFPRMIEPDITLLALLTDDATGDTVGTYSGTAMDRAEALVFFLGGYSKNIQLPISGPGGPLEFVGAPSTPAERLKISKYQYNATRDNALFDFDPTRLTFTAATPRTSTDEGTLGITVTVNDLLPTYVAVAGENAPLVYFDSRTYGVIGNDGTNNIYNGYLGNGVGGTRPYKTSVGQSAPIPPATDYVSEAAAFAAIKFHNADTFQIISPGSDGIFGSCVSTVSGTPGAIPTAHFVSETGQVVQPLATARNPDELIFSDAKLGSKGFQDSQWDSAITVNGHLDNVTNFSSATLGDDLQ